MACKEVAFLGFQASNAWLKAVAFSNRERMSLTEDTSHALIRPSKDAAATNISSIVSTWEVSQSSRFWSKASAK